MGALLTLAEIKAKARGERARIVAQVIFADDRIALVEAGPRGGWRIIEKLCDGW